MVEEIICIIVMFLFGTGVGWYFGFNRGAKFISDMNKEFMDTNSLEYMPKNNKKGGVIDE